MGILNFDEIPASKRAKAKLNILACKPNKEPDKYTDLEWIDELIWKRLEKWNKHGKEILDDLAAEPVEDIRTE